MSTNNNNYLKVPSVVLQDKRLLCRDKLVMADIDYLDKLGPKPGCWATNEQIAKFLGMSKSSISNSIQKLTELKLLTYEGIGKARVLLSNLLLDEPIKNAADEEENNRLRTRVEPIKNQDEPIKNADYKQYKLYKSRNGKKKDYGDSEAESPSASLSNSKSKSKPDKKGKRRKRGTKAFEHDSSAYQLSEFFLLAQYERDETVHPEFIKDEEKKENTLQTWAYEFNLLLNRVQPDAEEVKDVILFTQRSKYWPQAKYSASFLNQQYLPIRDMMKDWKDSSPQTPKQKPVLIEDPCPEATDITRATWFHLNGLAYTTSVFDENHIRLCTKKLIESGNSLQKDDSKYIEKFKLRLNDLEEYLKEALQRKEFGFELGIKIGSLSSDYTWNKMLPQFLGQQLGIRSWLTKDGKDNDFLPSEKDKDKYYEPDNFEQVIKEKAEQEQKEIEEGWKEDPHQAEREFEE